jgi:hypothetical protein
MVPTVMFIVSILLLIASFKPLKLSTFLELAPLALVTELKIVARVRRK